MINLKDFILSSVLGLSLMLLLTGCPARDENGKLIECTKENPCKVE